MLRLVPILRKVQIMQDGMLFPVRGRQPNLHIELAPSFFLDLERRVLDRFIASALTPSGPL